MLLFLFTGWTLNLRFIFMPCLFSGVSDTEAGRAKKEVTDGGVSVTTYCVTEVLLCEELMETQMTCEESRRLVGENE